MEAKKVVEKEHRIIDDFGEKIGGARKDLASKRGISADLIQNLSNKEILSFVKKDNVWIKPNFKSDEYKRFEPDYLLFLHYLRLQMPSKLVEKEVQTLERLVGEVKSNELLSFIGRTYTVILQYIRDLYEREEIYQKMREIKTRSQHFVVPSDAGEEAFSIFESLLEYIESDEFKQEVQVPDIVNEFRINLFGLRCIKTLIKAKLSIDLRYTFADIDRERTFKIGTGNLDFTSVYTYISGSYEQEAKLHDFPNDFKKELKNSWFQSYVLKDGTITYALRKGGPSGLGFVGDPGGSLEQVINLIDKRLAAQELKKKADTDNENTVEGKIKMKRPQVSSVSRNLPAILCRPVEEDDYLEKFGLSGGEFGLWNDQKERQMFLNYGYEAFSDLAYVLNIHPKVIGLPHSEFEMSVHDFESIKKVKTKYRNLSIAFGARGHSRAIAHFEPERNVINLTKLKGAGSLAHEFGHAIDAWLICGLQLTMKKIVETAHENDEILPESFEYWTMQASKARMFTDFVKQLSDGNGYYLKVWLKDYLKYTEIVPYFRLILAFLELRMSYRRKTASFKDILCYKIKQNIRRVAKERERGKLFIRMILGNGTFLKPEGLCNKELYALSLYLEDDIKREYALKEEWERNIYHLINIVYTRVRDRLSEDKLLLVDAEDMTETDDDILVYRKLINKVLGYDNLLLDEDGRSVLEVRYPLLIEKAKEYYQKTRAGNPAEYTDNATLFSKLLGPILHTEIDRLKRHYWHQIHGEHVFQQVEEIYNIKDRALLNGYSLPKKEEESMEEYLNNTFSSSSLRRSNIEKIPTFYIKTLGIFGDAKYLMDEAEMFARAFECYVEEELTKIGYQSNYLVNGTKEKMPIYSQRLLSLPENLGGYNEISVYPIIDPQEKDDILSKVKQVIAITRMVLDKDLQVPFDFSMVTLDDDGKYNKALKEAKQATEDNKVELRLMQDNTVAAGLSYHLIQKTKAKHHFNISKFGDLLREKTKGVIDIQEVDLKSHERDYLSQAGLIDANATKKSWAIYIDEQSEQKKKQEGCLEYMLLLLLNGTVPNICSQVEREKLSDYRKVYMLALYNFYSEGEVEKYKTSWNKSVYDPVGQKMLDVFKKHPLTKFLIKLLNEA